MSWLRLSLMRARRRFSSSGFRLCRRARRPRLQGSPSRPPPPPLCALPPGPGSYLAQLRRVPCPPRQPHARRESGAAAGPARGRLVPAQTPSADRGPQRGVVRDRSGRQWSARHARSPALRRQRARSAPSRPAEPVRLWVPPPPLFLRGVGAEGGTAEAPSSRSRPRVPSAASPGRPPPRAPAGVCVGAIEALAALTLGQEASGWCQALVPSCPTPPFFPHSGSAPPLSPALGLGRLPSGGRTPKSRASGSYHSGFYYGEGLGPPVVLRGCKGRLRPGRRPQLASALTTGNWPGRTRAPVAP